LALDGYKNKSTFKISHGKCINFDAYATKYLVMFEFIFSVNRACFCFRGFVLFSVCPRLNLRAFMSLKKIVQDGWQWSVHILNWYAKKWLRNWTNCKQLILSWELRLFFNNYFLNKSRLHTLPGCLNYVIHNPDWNIKQFLLAKLAHMFAELQTATSEIKCHMCDASNMRSALSARSCHIWWTLLSEGIFQRWHACL